MGAGLLSPLAYLDLGRGGLRGAGSSGVGVGEGVGVLVLRSLRSVLSFKGSPAGDVLAGGGAPIVVIWVGGCVVHLWSLDFPSLSCCLHWRLTLALLSSMRFPWIGGPYVATQFPVSSFEASRQRMLFLSLGSWLVFLVVLLPAVILSRRVNCSSSALSAPT